MPDLAPSVLSSWTKVIIDALSAAEIDSTAVLAEAGLSPDSLRNPNARLPAEANARLWKAAAERAGDPAFGLTASRYVRQTTFHALGYAVFASASLRDALHRLVRYSQLVSDATELHLSTTPTTACLSFEYVVETAAPAEESIDAVMSLIVRTCRGLTGRSFTMVRVERRRAEPRDPTPYERFFRCPIVYEAPADSLTCDALVLDQPLPTANAELASHNDDLAQRYLIQMGRGTLVDRVRATLVDRMSADPTPASVGAALGMSARSLQRRLQEHGTTYANVLGETRRELARGYLRETQYSITEVAFLLGFEDSSAFARAFRRWTGVSPSEFRVRTGAGARAD